MAFQIPNESVATFPVQAAPDSVDIDALVAALSRTGVVSGCAVTAQGTPDNTVAVAAGIVEVAGVRATVTGGNLTMTAAHATLPRRDIIVVDNAGTKSYVAGTAEAITTTSVPKKPAIPANSVLLYEIYVPANDNVIDSTQILDKRCIFGTRPRNVTAKTAAYTLLTTDERVTGDSTSAPFTFSLPAVAGNAGLEYVIYRINGGSNDITIDPNGAETIDGAATFILDAQWDSVSLLCTGSAWLVT